MTAPFMLDAETVAAVLNVSVSSLYKQSKRNALPFPALQLGKLWRYKRTDVESYLGVSIEEALGEVPDKEGAQ